MRSYPLNVSASVTFNGSGAGTVALGPNVGQRWSNITASIAVSQPVVNEPMCSLYMGAAAIPGNLIDGTYTGSLNSSTNTSSRPLTAGQRIFAVWSGGDSAATATLTLTGTLETEYRT